MVANMNQPIADPEAIEDRISILDEIERDYHETLRAFVGHFRRNENPPQALVDLAEELLRRINALRVEIEKLLRRSLS